MGDVHATQAYRSVQRLEKQGLVVRAGSRGRAVRYGLKAP